jgi:hypothetical protein
MQVPARCFVDLKTLKVTVVYEEDDGTRLEALARPLAEKAYKNRRKELIEDILNECK